ncbi:hypothetical protein ACHAWU_000712 [Discostella pseudostelligera]|uniref:Queuosine 5'-phosphate N-glycosylase/hydrolase n=1 Tax=Discostella pseudostelligera TaxID=259834 RepID=A0ABD3M941_9STRA
MNFSPTAAVRESTRRWMETARPFNGVEDIATPVTIDDYALDNFATEITQSILSNKSLEVTDWDADGWHYSGKNYKCRLPNESHRELMRMERVALYILSLDAINFCFWPTPTSTSTSCLSIKNGLEYEHLAIALQKIAEADDDSLDREGEVIDVVANIVKAASSYALSPTSLSTLTSEKIHSMLSDHFPPSTSVHDDSGGEHLTVYDLPNIEHRCRLLRELGDGLIKHHNGSAFNMLSKANKSADVLVGIILETFPGFRDYVDKCNCSENSSNKDWETVKKSQWIVHFYKRAQIATADIWAALGRCQATATESITDVCKFTDINLLTTFPDYRVPQILRHVGVMKYTPSLANIVDTQEELCKGCTDEISIRAGTVLAVEKIVQKVKEKILIIDGASGVRSQHDLQKLDDISAVKIDWYLWQKGERLDRLNLLGQHHRVNTTFY